MKVSTAKKEYKCADCGKPIPAGSRYWSDYRPSTPDTLGSNRKTHTNCAEHEQRLTANEKEFQP